MSKRALCVAVVMLVGLLSVARADVVVLQNTAADRTIVDDMLMDGRSSDCLRNFGGGGNSGGSDDLTFYGGLTGTMERAFVLRFNDIASQLPASVVADPTNITRVTLGLYQKSVGYAGQGTADNVSFFRLLKNWDEGTRTFPDIGSSVDGATTLTRVPGTANPAGWARTGATTYVWELPVGSGIGEVGYATNNQFSRLTKRNSVAEVDANVKSWYYDSGSGTLYVNKNNNGGTSPSASAEGIEYYTTAQAWQTVRAAGATDCEQTNGQYIDIPSDYHEWQVIGTYNQNYDPTPNVDKWVYVDSGRGDSPTELLLLDWVRGWVDGSIDNDGLLVNKGKSASEWNNRTFATSDAYWGALNDYTRGPILTIEFTEPPTTTVPEPAAVGLLGLTLLALKRRRE